MNSSSNREFLLTLLYTLMITWSPSNCKATQSPKMKILASNYSSAAILHPKSQINVHLTAHAAPFLSPTGEGVDKPETH